MTFYEQFFGAEMCAKNDPIKLEKCLELRNIVVEKVLLGAIVGAAAYFASMSLENFKSNLAHERFLAEAKWNAIQDLRDLHSHISQAMYNDIDNDIGKKKAYLDLYNNYIELFTKHWNKTSILFQPEMAQDMQKIISMHDAVVLRKVDLTKEHRGFVVMLGEKFDSLTRVALGQEVLGRSVFSETPVFKFVKSTIEDDLEKDPGEVFLENFEKYRSEH